MFRKTLLVEDAKLLSISVTFIYVASSKENFEYITLFYMQHTMLSKMKQIII